MAKTKDEIIFDEYVHSQAIFNRYDFASPENFADQLEYIVEELEKEILKSGNKKKADRLKKLKYQANKELENVYKELEKDLTDEMENSSKYAYESTNKAFNVAFDIKAPSFEALPVTAISIFTSLSEKVYLNDGDKQRFFKPSKEINKLLKDHKKEYVRAINKSLAFGLGAKESAKTFKDSAQNINGVKNRHIDSLVRTTIADSMSRAREYSEDKNFSDVIKGYQHISVMDTRTSSICAFRAGMIKKNREDFEDVPPLHFRCVLPDTNVLPIGRISYISKRPFDGKVVTIRTLGNKTLTVTMNHPILKDVGFVNAKFIKKGDTLVTGVNCDSIVSSPNNYKMESTIENSFNSFVSSGKMLPCPMPISTEDFHGDITKDEIAIILIDRKLPDKIISSISHHFVKSFLKITGVSGAINKPCFSSFDDFVISVFSSCSADISLSSKLLSILKARIIHSGLLLLGSISGFKSIFNQSVFDEFNTSTKSFRDTINPDSIIKKINNFGSFNIMTSVNSSSRDAISFENCRNGLFIDSDYSSDFGAIKPFFTEFDTVIDVSFTNFSGHVYNLSCENNIYFANGIITHNCRSMIVPITSLTDTKTLDTTTRTWDEEIYADRQGEIHTRFKLASDKDIKIKVPSQKSKFNSFDIAFQSWSKERQIQYLGPQKYKLYKDGKISIKSLLDGSGRIRTVKELAKLSGLNMEELKEIRKRDIKAYKPKITRTAKKVFEERKANKT